MRKLLFLLLFLAPFTVFPKNNPIDNLFENERYNTIPTVSEHTHCGEIKYTLVIIKDSIAVFTEADLEDYEIYLHVQFAKSYASQHGYYGRIALENVTGESCV